MKNLQKMGGIAALYEAAVYVLGMVFFLLIVDYPSVVDPAQKVALLVDDQAIMYVMYLLLYVIFGIALVVLALALYERLRTGSPALAQTATAIGLIWACVVIASGYVFNAGMATAVDLYGKDPAQAVTVWLALESVSMGLGGVRGEILGGIWVLLASWAALGAGEFPRALNYLGVAIGVAGILSAVPALGEQGLGINYIFALGQIPWFVWLGIIMLRGRTSAAT